MSNIKTIKWSIGIFGTFVFLFNILLIESSIIIGLVGFGITIYSIALGIKLCDLQKELKKKELEKEGVEQNE